MNNQNNKTLITVGWREWLALPELGIPKIKAKVDTGARTSTLHAFGIKPFKENGKHLVKFNVHPKQRRMDIIVECVADLMDIRWVTDSGGHRERRFVIRTLLQLDHQSWPIEITLTNRDDMKFRMLLGRAAMRNRIMVDPAVSYLIKQRLVS